MQPNLPAVDPHPPGVPGRRAVVAIWPSWQRVLHVVLAGSVILALASFEGGVLHERAGWIALAAALARIALGFAGPRRARFVAFLRGPRATLEYARAWRRAREPRHLNHNPLGAWMVVVLLAFAALGAATGALYTTDRYWGEAWVIDAHAALAWPLTALLPLHLAGVVLAGRRHRENLVAAMLHGRKRAPGPGDVDA